MANERPSILQPLIGGAKRHHIKISSARNPRTLQTQRMNILHVAMKRLVPQLPDAPPRGVLHHQRGRHGYKISLMDF